jgi:hypothetical protein
MTFTDIIGSLGVFLLLLAYFLNGKNILSKTSTTYLILNIIGAGLACLASVLLQYWPFIILEACWMLVSFASLIINCKNLR